jgi:hypothetical protein
MASSFEPGMSDERVDEWLSSASNWLRQGWFKLDCSPLPTSKASAGTSLSGFRRQSFDHHYFDEKEFSS